jgi:PadR family transcriptional regulator PadR
MEFDKSQLMRGTLEGCILKVISGKTTYGYEILEYLKNNGFSDIAEGTLYPLLLRLEKQGNISSELLPSPLGPRRKYFSITEKGKEYLKEFEHCWSELAASVGRIIGGGEENE